MYRPKKKISFGSAMMKIAASLFCLVLISTSMLSGLYARYTTDSTGGDSARVIKFGNITLTETGSFVKEKELIVIPGVDLTKKVMVSFDGSEASTLIFIEITPSSHWNTSNNQSFSANVNEKNIMSFDISSDWKFLKLENGSYIYYYYTTLAPNTPIENVDIIANDGKITVSKNINHNDVTLMNDITLNISATVVQSGGFESVSDAWSSLSK